MFISNKCHTDHIHYLAIEQNLFNMWLLVFLVCLYYLRGRLCLNLIYIYYLAFTCQFS